LETALEEISKYRGIHYDPAVVDICLRLFREKGFSLSGKTIPLSQNKKQPRLLFVWF